MGTFLACSQTFSFLLSPPPPAKIWGPVNGASAQFSLLYALSTISKVRMEVLWKARAFLAPWKLTKEKKKKVPLQISQHSPSGIMVFPDAQLVFGQEGGEQLDWPSWNSEYRHDRINSVLTTFHVHNDMFIMTGKKGQNVRKRKRPSLWQGRKERKGKRWNKLMYKRKNERKI